MTNNSNTTEEVDFFLVDADTTTVPDNNNDENMNTMFDWMSDVPMIVQQQHLAPLCVTSLSFSDPFALQTAHDFSPTQLLQAQYIQQPIYMQQQPQPQQLQNIVLESPSADLETSLAADEQKQEAASQKPAMTKSSLMDLVEGFITPPSQKQYGGKDNREILPIHIVRLHTSLLLPLQNNKLKIQVDLHGYKKMSRVKTHLAHVADLNFKVTGSDVDVTFDELVIRHSSHNCGQKLLLRFTLVDESNQSYDFVDTAEFETITKRGIEKQRQKQRASTKKRDSNATPVNTKTYKFKPSTYEQAAKQHQQMVMSQQQQQPVAMYNVFNNSQPLWFQAPQHNSIPPQGFALQQSQVLANPSILDILLDTHQFRQAVLQ